MDLLYIKLGGLIALPLILGVLVFFPGSTDLKIAREGNNSTIKMPDFVELNEKSGFLRMIRAVFSTPFDLKHYVVKIKDSSEYDGPKGDLGYDLYIDGKKQHFLKAGRQIKTTLLADKAHILETKIKISQGDAPSGSKVSFKIAFDASARPSWWDVTAKIFLFIIAWNGIFFIGKEIFKFIKA